MNPNPRSPNDVLADRHYRHIDTHQVRVSGGSIYLELIVMHCGTDTFWLTRYGYHAAHLPAEWFQVKRRVVTQHAIWELV